MSFDVNQAEQQAMQLQAKGRDEGALKLYLQILKHDPNSRRIRKTVGDLYLKLGDTRQAEKRYLEVVESMVKDAQFRSAIPLYKELCKLRSKDPDMFVELGDCYVKSNFPNDAFDCYTKAVEMTSRSKPEYAQDIQRKVIRLRPSELAERVKLAEILEFANWAEKASDEWSALANVSRKIGKPDDQARFLERAIMVRDHWELRKKAAKARLMSGDSKKALQHLTKIYKTHGNDHEVCILLATGLQRIRKTAQAAKVWLQAAEICAEKKHYDELLKSYRAAVECGVNDPEINKKIAQADAAEKKTKLRLHSQKWARPGQRDLEPVVRAEIFFEYGLKELDLKTLKKITVFE